MSNNSKANRDSKFLSMFYSNGKLSIVKLDSAATKVNNQLIESNLSRLRENLQSIVDLLNNCITKLPSSEVDLKDALEELGLILNYLQEKL